MNSYLNGYAWILSAAEFYWMADRNETWALPGLLLGAVGVFALVTGFMANGPDRVGGLVFGSVALAAASVILWRRTPRRRDPEPHEDADPET